MNTPKRSTLRIQFPQWQGGNHPAYHFGAQLLAWLAPRTDGPSVTIEVEAPDGQALNLEMGIVGRTMLLDQLTKAEKAIAAHAPERIVVLGGDCLVDLAPFAYLNQKYADDLAILWVDAHPDIMSPVQFQHAHAMVLGNLLGHGDPEFRAHVPVHVRPENVMYAGIHRMSAFETDFIATQGLRYAGPEALAASSAPVLDWLKATGKKRLAIHLDLDVLDPAGLRSLLFAEPNIPADRYADVAQGRMTIPQVVRLLDDVSAEADIVGLGITEHLPWDAIALKDMLSKLPLLRD